MSVQLTASAITKAIKELEQTGRRDLSDAGHPGLRLRLTPGGGRTWALAMRDRLGRMKRFNLGTYPEMGISDARDAARIMYHKVKVEGADPIADRKRDRAMGEDAKSGIGTLAAVLDIYATKATEGQKRWDEARSRINLVFKPVLDRPAKMLIASDLRMCADAYHSVTSASFAVRSIRPALKWAAERGLLDKGLADIRQPATTKRRTRFLSRDELAAILPVLRDDEGPYAAALHLMILTLCRRSEAAGAVWRDVDLDAGTWTLPDTKNGEDHVIPLPHQVIKLFQSRRPKKPKPAELVFATASGAPLASWDKATKVIHAASKTADWSRHDLRRTGATVLGDLGVLPDIIAAALNHVSIRSTLEANYNRSRYRPQVADALQRLADTFDEIEAEGRKRMPPKPA